MAANRQFLFRIFFKLRVHGAHGDAFQSLFSSVMAYADPRFETVQPWGAWGDGGNDGWIPADGHYFQVYGPKPTSKPSETTALNKAIADFNKLPKKWKDVRSFSFVFNDRFTGTPAPIGSALQKLKLEKKLEHAGMFSMQMLLERFMGLDEDKRQDILGAAIPTEELEVADTEALGELLSSLIAFAAAKPYFLTETAPDFDSKIEFNGLSPRVASRLRSASYQVSVVDDFLDTTDAGTKQALSQQIRGFYQDSKVEVPDGDEASDERYFWLMNKLASPNLPALKLSAYRSAAELVLAKYFETCDAYEHPDGTPSA